MADDSGNKTDKSGLQESTVSAKPYLSFSIENILAKGPFGRKTIQSQDSAKKNDTAKNESERRPVETLFSRLPWLAYTRYCPPKIPRSKPRKGCRRHRLDRNPRIPFSSAQLAALEAKFVQTQYLSGSEVRDLSASLQVTEHRVKIWFQNRRAREKKTRATEVLDSETGRI